MTNLGMERLLLEIEQTMPTMPDEFFQQLRRMIDSEQNKRIDDDWRAMPSLMTIELNNLTM